MKNLYERLTDLLAGDPLRVGTIAQRYSDGTVLVQLAEGGTLRVRAAAEFAAPMRVYLQDGVVTSAAPDLPFIEIEI
ncbi:hypothetical protein C2134_12565 [Chromobacterium sinusclupearum]|uniref:Uncharacterized protein n=1 Tax=Chromobacterium sinusclupearum TaxID=2077146 RepID=A0A2K4MND1_9NEIS|nr:hypothetical protein [Chromobacterium sinusclupearum]POA98275.1 hypothetical protein C2134_12565 [Chromobacterium sinusclupearum]